MMVAQVKQSVGILGQKAPAKQAAELKPLLLEENKIQVLMKKTGPRESLSHALEAFRSP